MKETDLLKPVIERLKFRGYEVKQEVPLIGCDRTIDIVADYNRTTIIAISGKMQLDDVVIEQARELVGICDGSYVAFPTPSKPCEAFVERMCLLSKYMIGCFIVCGNSIQETNARRDPNTQPDILRKSFDAATGDSVKAGSPTGSCNNAETAYKAKLAEAISGGPIPLQVLKRVVGPSPCGGSRATMNKIRKWIANRELAARIDEQRNELVSE